MTFRLQDCRRGLLALGIAGALALPLPGHAQDSAREQKLEQRVAQLEQELAELKSAIMAQKNAPPPPPAVAAAAPPKASAPTFTSAPGLSVALHGFINVSAFSQNKSYTFGNGQNAEYPTPGSSGNLSGFDVRNTRFWLDFTGAQLNENWSGGGRIEMDFFGGFNGTGPYSVSQPTPRLRQAYMDLSNPDMGSKVRIGQQWDLMFPIDNTPTSLSHIAFPLGYGAGIIGWRFPGVVWMQDLNKGSGTKLRLDVGAFQGSWNGPGNNVNYLSAGNVDFQPQLEARLRAQGDNWIAYVAGHYSKVDLSGVDGTVATPIKSEIDSTAIEIGGTWKPGPWTFKGLLYTGNGIGEIFGNLSQFGDISDTGGFVQAGYNVTKNWSVNAFYAYAKSDHDDVVRWLGNGATGLLKNRQTALSLQYASGAYQLGVELIHDKLDSTSDGVNRRTTSGNQVSLNAMYTF